MWGLDGGGAGVVDVGREGGQEVEELGHVKRKERVMATGKVGTKKY